VSQNMKKNDTERPKRGPKTPLLENPWQIMNAKKRL